MCGILKKRGREDENVFDSAEPEPKRLDRNTEQLFYLLEDMDSLDKIQDDDWYASEELISGVMRSLEEEIGSIFPEGDDSVASHMTTRSGTDTGGIDLCYLLGASDDELGIPVAQLVEENQAASGLSFDFEENQEDESFGYGGYFDSDLADYAHFSLFQHPHLALDDGDFRDFDVLDQDYWPA